MIYRTILLSLYCDFCSERAEFRGFDQADAISAARANGWAVTTGANESCRCPKHKGQRGIKKANQ